MEDFEAIIEPIQVLKLDGLTLTGLSGRAAVSVVLCSIIGCATVTLAGDLAERFWTYKKRKDEGGL